MCIRDRYQRRVRGRTTEHMQLLLNLPSRPAMTIKMRPCDTVESLIQAVADKEGQGMDDLYLVFGRRTLHPTATLEQCGLESGCVVRARLRIRGGGNMHQIVGFVTPNLGLMLQRTDSTTLVPDAESG
eukprot:TRINITY_DN3586_c0_g1_i6.p2 TRINITY_DN3586_c0_g1~~TRINITY_DN3586_c0_g1_i6.p2  ORF type:complete len:128 (+),score=22.98 TRINITY_DN3586_c0_g1_i6:77-460(+)